MHPLLELLDEGRPAGVVLASAIDARLLEWRLGKLQVLSRLEREELEAPHERAGQIGGGPPGQFQPRCSSTVRLASETGHSGSWTAWRTLLGAWPAIDGGSGSWSAGGAMDRAGCGETARAPSRESDPRYPGTHRPR